MAAAEDEARQAVALRPNDYGIVYNLAYVLLHRGRYDEAVKQFRRSISLNPRRSDSYVFLGVTLEKMGRYNEAEKEFVAAFQLDPYNFLVRDHFITHIDNGKMAILNNLRAEALKLIEKGDYKKAETLWRKYLLIDPDSAAAWNNLGVALQGQGRYLAAEACFREATRLAAPSAETQKIAQKNLDNIKSSPGHGTALKELMAAKQSGEIASKELIDEAKRGGSVICFDDSKGCSYSPDHSLESVLFAPPKTGGSSPPKPVPEELMRDPEFIALTNEKDQLEKRHKEAYDALQAAQALRDKDQKNKGTLDLLIAEQKNKLSQLKSEEQVNDIKIKKRMEDLGFYPSGN